MARKNIIEFIVKLVDDASNDLKKLEGSFVRFAKSMAKKAALAATAVATLAGTFLVLYRNMTKSYAEFSRFSESLGISVETLSQLEYAARQTGVGMTTLKRAVEQMSSAIDSAQDGVGIAADALYELDLNAQELNKLGMEDQFLVLADAFNKLDSETRQVILSQDIFGDGASEIIRIFKGGSPEIRRFAEEADRLGITIKTSTAEEARKFREELGKLELQTRALEQTIINELGPTLRDLIGWFSDLVVETGKVLRLFRLVNVEVDDMADPFRVQSKNADELRIRMAQVAKSQEMLMKRFGGYGGVQSNQNAAFQWFRNETEMAAIIKRLRELNSELRKTGLAGGKTASVGGAGKRHTLPLLTTGHKFKEIPFIPHQRSVDNRPESIRQIDAQLEALNKMWAELAEEAARKTAFMQSLADQAARGIQTAMADFFFDPFSEGLDGMLKQFINVIRRMIAEWLAFQTLNFFNIGGFFSKITGRASGGPVTAGTPYIVGERGPELFVPGKSGSIVPGLPGGMGGMNFVTNIDARGADPSLISRLPQIMENRDRRLMLKMKDYIETGGTTL